MCPPLGGLTGDSFSGTGLPAGPGATLEFLVRELATQVTVRMSSLPYSPAAWQTCRDSFVNSPTLPPARRSGSAHMRLAQTTLTSLWTHYASDWTPCSQFRSHRWKRRALCQTGPCQRLQDQRAAAFFAKRHSWRE